MLIGSDSSDRDSLDVNTTICYLIIFPYLHFSKHPEEAQVYIL